MWPECKQRICYFKVDMSLKQTTGSKFLLNSVEIQRKTLHLMLIIS